MSLQESRVKKTLLNARVNLIFYFLTLALSFFSRKIFLDTLGADFVGLTGTLQNLLGFLNLAELGIGSAIGYLLYKPLYDRDQAKISEIISVMGYLYRWIGIVICGAGIILSFFLPLIFPATGFQLPVIYFVYFSFLGSSLIGYFINYRQNLLGADQRNYVVTAYYQSIVILKTVIQMALAYYTGSYYLWAVIELAFGIIYSFILNWKINQTYPWLKTQVSEGRQLLKSYPEVKVKTRQLFIHKIAAFIQQQLTPFLIYAFVSLEIVAYYGNYTIVVTKIGQFISTFFSSSDAAVGNLIAEGNKDKMLKTYWELVAIRFLIASTMVFVIYHLVQPFISLWLGAEYILGNNVVILMLSTTFISTTRGATDSYLFGFGLFADIYAPLIEGLIFVAVAIAGGALWGLNGVLLGSIMSLLVIIWGWKPYYLFKKGFKLPFVKYLKWFIVNGVVTLFAFKLGAYVVSQLIKFIDPFAGFSDWIIVGLIITLFFGMMEFALLYLFTPGMRNITKRFINHRTK